MKDIEKKVLFDYTKNLEEDISALKELLCKDFAGQSPVVWHCCTPTGYGYYSVKGDKLAFVKSHFCLQLLGACWSGYVWGRLFVAQGQLNEYLGKLGTELNPLGATLVVRQLYLPWILREEHLKDNGGFCIREDYEEVLNLLNNLPSYKEEHKKDIEEYRTFDTWTEYYNRDGGVYYLSQSIIQKAVNQLYGERNRLEAVGLWSSTRSLIDDLYDMVYMRGAYEHWPNLDCQRQ